MYSEKLNSSMPMRPQGEARQATEGAAITSPTPGAGRRGQDEVPEGVHQGELPHTADCPQSLGRLAILDTMTARIKPIGMHIISTKTIPSEMSLSYVPPLTSKQLVVSL